MLVAHGEYEGEVTVTVSSLSLTSEVIGGATIRNIAPGVTVLADSLGIRGFRIETIANSDGKPVLDLLGDAFLVEDCELVGARDVLTIDSYEETRGTIRRCTVSGGKNGAAIHGGHAVTFEACDFVRNGTLGGLTDDGAVEISANGESGPVVTVRDCQFVDNRTGGGGGAIYVDGTNVPPTPVLMVERCTFTGNRAVSGAAIYSAGADVVIRASTFVGNTVEEVADGQYGGVLEFDYEATATVENCLVAFNDAPGIRCWDFVDVAISCSDVFGNGDDALCGTDGGGNFSLDPLFCSNDLSSLTLQSSSPCAPKNGPEGPPCGLVGAHGVACVTPVRTTTWGALKSRFSSTSRR